MCERCIIPCETGLRSGREAGELVVDMGGIVLARTTYRRFVTFLHEHSKLQNPKIYLASILPCEPHAHQRKVENIRCHRETSS
jgi:hypothetical protein